MTNTIEQARRNYIPSSSIKVLFIAEAPPEEPKRFFYFDQVDSHDWLFLGLMRVIYEDARDATVCELRRRKREFLERFQADGYYLIDARDEAMPARASPATKRHLLTDSLGTLVEKLRELVDGETRIVLISSAVYAVCFAPLRVAGFNVINTELIDFPCSGRQPHFKRKLGPLLDDYLQSTIRGLEESVRFFGAGKDQQKKRDRWVVEHFLRGLGVPFVAGEISQPDDDPPDATFRDAAFEVKEVQDRGRRRGDEYRRLLEKAREAESSDELLEHFSPEDIRIAEVYRRIMEETQILAEKKYRSPAVRRDLDLLFYVNLGMKTAWGIDDGARPNIDPIIAQGWRSVSFLHGSSTSCVIFASGRAANFLLAVQGRLIHASDAVNE